VNLKLQELLPRLLVVQIKELTPVKKILENRANLCVIEMKGTSANKVVETLPYLQIMPSRNCLGSRITININQIILIEDK
jgi:hypothetical protein